MGGRSGQNYAVRAAVSNSESAVSKLPIARLSRRRGVETTNEMMLSKPRTENFESADSRSPITQYFQRRGVDVTNHTTLSSPRSRDLESAASKQPIK